MMNDLPEWIAGCLIVGAFLLVMTILIAIGVRLARWALLKDERSDYERWSGE